MKHKPVRIFLLRRTLFAAVCTLALAAAIFYITL